MKPQLAWPINNPVITQLFGANPIFYSDPKYGGIKGHNGIDFQAYHGQPIYASHDGLAQFEIDNSGGHGVVIYNEAGFKTIYWHLCDSTKEPQFKSPIEDGPVQVKTGDLIGYADSTGASTGDHCHWGFKFCLKDENTGAWYNTNQNNGYNGAEDPLPYCDKLTPDQIQIIKKEITINQTLVYLYQRLKNLLVNK